MFYKLPEDTVFEAKERTKRATVLLFVLLVLLYIFFANFMAFSVILILSLDPRIHLTYSPAGVAVLTTLIAALWATGHFAYVRAKTLDDMLESIGAKNADPKDQYHKEFIRLVSEAEAASGIHGIRPVILNTPGCNAFSLQDGKGNCAIGATEGILSKLTDPELSGVVAHEAAHLIHEDSRLITTATFLFSIFGSIHAGLGALLSGGVNSGYASSYSTRSRRGGNGGAIIVILVLWVISGIGFLLTKLIGMAISREREYLADADGVALCKDPLSLAEALYKISHRYRGDCPPTYASVFILDPQASELAEQEGIMADLFSTHPPVDKRLTKLLNWAKSDLATLQQIDEKEAKQIGGKQTASSTPVDQAGASFMAYLNNQWAGPYTGPQLLAMSALGPGTWICPAGTQNVQKASEIADLVPLFQKQVQGLVSGEKCPRCKVSLTEQTLDGTSVEKCSFCNGYLLKAGILDRLITRDPGAFKQDEIQKAKVWRSQQRGPLKERNAYPEIECPFCGESMGKTIHSSLTQVVIDRCSNDSCRAIWCDGGELETILMLVRDAKDQTKSGGTTP